MVMDSPDEFAWLRRLATAVAAALVEAYPRTGSPGRRMCSEPRCWLLELCLLGSASRCWCRKRFGDLRGGPAVAVGELLAERVGADDADVDGAEVDGLHSMWSKLLTARG